jgi:Zn-dependent protease with chaperone function
MFATQMMRAIKVGMRSRLLVCILVLAAAFYFWFGYKSHHLVSGILLLVGSELMVMLWIPRFFNNLIGQYKMRKSITWANNPSIIQLRSISQPFNVRLNKIKPFGILKGSDNAWANPFTRQIVVGEKTLRLLKTPEELTALVGHELTHIGRHHHLKMAFWTFAVPITLALPFYLTHAPIIITELVFYAVFFVAFLLVSWHNEYEADAGAAIIAGQDAMISVLHKLVPEKNWVHESETHPSVNNRVRKLEKVK